MERHQVVDRAGWVDFYWGTFHYLIVGLKRSYMLQVEGMNLLISKPPNCSKIRIYTNPRPLTA